MGHPPQGRRRPFPPGLPARPGPHPAAGPPSPRVGQPDGPDPGILPGGAAEAYDPQAGTWTAGAGPVRIAVCGPGREVRTALILALHGETVDEIQASRHLPDPDAIYLIRHDPFVLPPFDPADYRPPR